MADTADVDIASPKTTLVQKRGQPIADDQRRPRVRCDRGERINDVIARQGLERHLAQYGTGALLIERGILGAAFAKDLSFRFRNLSVMT